MRTNQPTQLMIGGRIVAQIEKGALRKNVMASRHQLRRPQAWAFSSVVIEKARLAGCNRIEIYDKESKSWWTVSLGQFLQQCFKVQRSGFEEQKALGLEHWQNTKQLAEQAAIFS